MREEKIKIIGVLVVYRCEISESPTIKSLLKDYSANPVSYENFQLIVYDNSDIAQPINIEIPFSWKLVRDHSNPGLAKAYNFALSVARAELVKWLLLLDQDSILPIGYMGFVNKELEIANSVEKIKAVAPLVEDNGRFISPAKDGIGGILRPLNKIQFGPCFERIHCIGSGSIVKVDIFEKIGEFSIEFPVDGLDRWLYHQIYTLGWICCISRIKIQHSLSVFNYKNFVSHVRYIQILAYEYKFLKKYRRKMDLFIYEIRLVIRSIKLYIKLKDKKYAKITIRHAVKKYNDKANNYNRDNNLQ